MLILITNLNYYLQYEFLSLFIYNFFFSYITTNKVVDFHPDKYVKVEKQPS